MDQKKDVEQSREGSLEETKHFKSSTPGILFFRIFAWSCRVLSATQDSTCQKCSSKQVTTICQNMSVYHLAETNMPKHATTNMPNHVRIPPVKNKDTGIKHGSIPPEAKSKAIVAAPAHAQITNALQCVTRSILCTKHATLNSHDRSWGPARHTELAWSQLGSGTPHWTRRIAVEVRHTTLNSRDHSWGPARHTELAGSRLGSGTPHWTRRIAVGVRHATLNSQDRGWGPARHTELTTSRLEPGTPHWTHRIAVEIRRGGGRQEEEEEGGGRRSTGVQEKEEKRLT